MKEPVDAKRVHLTLFLNLRPLSAQFVAQDSARHRSYMVNVRSVNVVSLNLTRARATVNRVHPILPRHTVPRNAPPVPRAKFFSGMVFAENAQPDHTMTTGVTVLFVHRARLHAGRITSPSATSAVKTRTPLRIQPDASHASLDRCT